MCLRWFKPSYLVSLILLVMLAVSTACGASSNEESPPGAATLPAGATPTPTSAAATGLPVATATSVPGPTVPAAALGDKLTVALSSFDNEEMAPHLSGKVSGMALATQYADYLMGVTPDNQYSNAWGLADSWEMIDGMTYDFTLKEGVKFHDGVLLDAEDIQKNLDLLASDEAVGSTCLYCGQWAQIYDYTEILNPHKIRVHLSSPFPFLFNLLPPVGGSDLYMFSVAAWERGGMTSEGYQREEAIGTGPWKFEERRIGQYARYTRWDEYYSEPFRARFKELDIILVPEDAARLATVSTGGADMANMTGLLVPEIEAAGLKIDGPKAVDNAYIAFYQSYDPGHCTNKLEVRKALNLAVDVDAVVQALWPGGTARRIPHAFTSPYVEGWIPDLPLYPYDPEQARQLLQESGCAGMRVNAYAAYGPATPEFADMVEAVSTYWSAIGVKVNLIPIESAAYQGRRQAEQMGADREDNPVGPHWIPSSRNFGDMIRTHGICPSNGGGTTCGLPEQQRWLARMNEYFAEQDPVARNELAKEISRELYDYYPHVPIASRDAIWALDGDRICGDWQPIDGTAVALMFNTIEPCP